jgi:membrane protein implicated in regulation of membrane protease activity
VEESVSKLLRALVGVIVFVVAFWLVALVIGGIASLAGLGIGGIEATIIAVIALVVAVLVVRRMPNRTDPVESERGRATAPDAPPDARP